MAVTNSLAALHMAGTRVCEMQLPSRCHALNENARCATGIFCTEPYRIPFAGKIDVCCFDKTGTLTSDKLLVRGIAAGKGAGAGDAADEDGFGVSDIAKASREAVEVMAACQSLVSVNNKMAGDPMEKITMEAIGWGFGGPDTVRPLSRRGSKSSDTAVRILRRFAFDSAVKRMSAIIERIGSSSSSAASKLWYVFFAWHCGGL